MTRLATTRPRHERVDWIGKALALGVLVLLGVVLGQQYVEPNKRVLAALAGLVVLGIAWRLDLVSGIGLLVLALPFPRGTVFGSTNLAFTLLLFIIWLLRLSLRAAPTAQRTPADVPIIGFVIAYILSFYNVRDPGYLWIGIQNFQLLLAGVFLFYLIVQNIRTSRDLQRVHGFQLVLMVLVALLGIYELGHPGASFIPGWIEFDKTTGTEFNLHNVRIGGPFFDYEALCEWSALNLLLVAFLWTRAKSTTRRVLVGGVGVLVMFVMFATVTRGAFVALGAGLAYLLWLERRNLQFVTLVATAALVIAAFLGMNFYVSHFTRSGDVLTRFGETKFVGWMPDARAGAWTESFNRWLEHPIIGHGPYYPEMVGVRKLSWPHNVYLYIANLVGVVGLAAYLWLLAVMLRISRRHGEGWVDPHYPTAFLVVAQVQLVVFVIDQFKIDFLRNPIYQFQVWVMFALLVASARIVREHHAARASEAAHATPPAATALPQPAA